MSSESRSVVSNSLWKLLSRVRLFATWDSPGQNTGVGSRSLLQGIFPTQGLNQGLLPCRRILYQLSYQGSPTEGHEHLSCKGLASTRTSKWKKKCKSYIPSSILECQYFKPILKASRGEKHLTYWIRHFNVTKSSTDSQRWKPIEKYQNCEERYFVGRILYPFKWLCIKMK